MIDSVQNLDLSVEDKRELLKNLLSLRQGNSGAGVPLSYNQQSLWFVYQLSPSSPAYNFLLAARVSNHLNVPALIRSFDFLIKRHPALRSRFLVHEQKPVQVVDDSLTLKIPVTDVFGKSAQEIETLCKEAADEPFNLERGPACARGAITYFPGRACHDPGCASYRCRPLVHGSFVARAGTSL